MIWFWWSLYQAYFFIWNLCFSLMMSSICVTRTDMGIWHWFGLGSEVGCVFWICMTSIIRGRQGSAVLGCSGIFGGRKHGRFCCFIYNWLSARKSILTYDPRAAYQALLFQTDLHNHWETYSYIWLSYV